MTPFRKKRTLRMRDNRTPTLIRRRNTLKATSTRMPAQTQRTRLTKLATRTSVSSKQSTSIRKCTTCSKEMAWSADPTYTDVQKPWVVGPLKTVSSSRQINLCSGATDAGIRPQPSGGCQRRRISADLEVHLAKSQIVHHVATVAPAPKWQH